MLCISAAYVVMRCLCVCPSVTFDTHVTVSVKNSNWLNARNSTEGIHRQHSRESNKNCRTRSLFNATFSFLITWRSSSSKSAAVYKNSWKSDEFFTKIWRYNDFQNGGRPPSWNCFIRDHPRSLCCRPQLPVKFHVNVIHWRYSYLNFSHIWLEMPIQATKMGVLGDLDP